MNRQTISSEQRWEGTDCVPRLTVFTFLWACQALVHQEFYSSWLHEDNPLGWALTSVALATLLWPKVLGLFIAMLATSIVYNVVKWPFVVNHILLESGINGTILLAIVLQLARRETRYGSREFRDQVFDAFAPVIRFMLVVMYYFAIVSKLNWDFLDPEVSAVSAMYVDLLRRIPVLPTSLGAKSLAIVLTLIIEAAIPIFLTFRRTRYAALAIGLPFHFMLGLIGHRTFSALAFALYSLYCIEPLSVVISQYYETWKQRWGLLRLQRATRLARLGVIGSVLLLVAADYTGHFRDGLGWAPHLPHPVADLGLLVVWRGLRLPDGDATKIRRPTAASQIQLGVVCGPTPVSQRCVAILGFENRNVLYHVQQSANRRRSQQPPVHAGTSPDSTPG